MSPKRTIGIVLAVGLAYVVIKGMANAPVSHAPVQSEYDKTYAAVQAGMQKRQDEENAAQPLKAYTARDIATAYSRNTVAADLVFKDQQFKVTGVIVNINTDYRGQAYVTLKGGVNQFMEPQFTLADSQKYRAAGLQQGSKLTLACTGRGDIAKIPMADDCTIIE
ncbi:hypothetical protein PS850_03806 [Pseudomonas fluorescens]|nr:hypothetical protein PS850_03806 [Pseudomonas fluorescens]